MATVLFLVPLTDPAVRVGLVRPAALHALAGCGLVAAVMGEYAARASGRAKGRPLYVAKESTADRSPGVARLPRAA